MNIIQVTLFIMVGGAGGALARFGVQGLFATRTPLPGWLAIMVVNVTGSFMIGLLACWLTGEASHLRLEHLSPARITQDEVAISEALGIFVIGFCGAFATFSTFSLDNFLLLITNRGQFLLNAVCTTVLAYIAVMAGWYIGGSLLP